MGKKINIFVGGRFNDVISFGNDLKIVPKMSKGAEVTDRLLLLTTDGKAERREKSLIGYKCGIYIF